MALELLWAKIHVGILWSARNAPALPFVAVDTQRSFIVTRTTRLQYAEYFANVSSRNADSIVPDVQGLA